MNREILSDDIFYAMKSIYKGVSKERCDAEIVLPDYKEDAGRIIRVEINPVITEKNAYFQGQNALCDIEGTYFAKVIYLTDRKNEKGMLSSYKFESNFSHSLKIPVSSFDTSKADMIAFLCDVKSENITWKLMSPKKLSLKCELSFDVSLKTNVLIDSFSEKDATVEKKTAEKTCATLIQSLEKDFTLEERITLPDEYMPIAEIISENCVGFVKKSENKNGITSFEGEIAFFCTYVSDSGETVSFYQPIEIKKEAETESFEKDAYTFVSLTAGEIESEISDDMDKKTLEVKIPYSVVINVYKNETTSVCLDAFSTENLLDITYENINFSSIVAEKTVKNQIECEFELKLDDAEKIEKTYADAEITNSYLENGKIAVEGKIKVHYILTRLGDNFAGGEENCAFKTFVDIEDEFIKSGTPQIELYPTLSFCEIGLIGNKCKVKGEICIDAFLMHEENEKCVVDVTESEKRSKPKGTLFLYYPDKNETLWDICKKYGVSPDAVKEKNGILNENELPNMLRIE